MLRGDANGRSGGHGGQGGDGKLGLSKGYWTEEEDVLLCECVEKYGEGNWYLIPHRAGLNRCRKSCRLRWLNYLRPNIKRGHFTSDEVDLIVRLHKLLGNRWSLIAGRLPGRTANNVKNYWNSRLLKKRLCSQRLSDLNCPKRTTHATITRTTSTNVVIKPRPQTFTMNSPWITRQGPETVEMSGQAAEGGNDEGNSSRTRPAWWEGLLEDNEEHKGHRIDQVGLHDWDDLLDDIFGPWYQDIQ